MRQAYIITYDICDDSRLRKVYKRMCGYGEHLQLSVFRCELDKTELVVLRDKLKDIINEHEDQVLFIDIGPADGRGGGAISTLGQPYTPPERRAIVV